MPPTPNAVQASLIAQHAAGARPREKPRTKDADAPRRAAIQDEVRLSDPVEAQEVEPKPDAAEEWKHRRTPPRDGGDRPNLDIRA